MDIEGLKITPAEGKLVVSFLDDEDEAAAKPKEETPYASAPSEYRKTCLATIRAVGPKCEFKKGQIAVMRESVRDYALLIDDNVFLIDRWDVQAVLTAPPD